jgi:hypothetical protein
MKLEISIPESLNEIKLKDFQKYQSIAKDNNEPNFLNRKLVEIFCGIKSRDINLIRKMDYDAILGTLAKVLDNSGKFTQRFELNGLEFGFIPKLEDISAGEWIDLSEYLKDFKDYHKAMAVLYRPITFSKKDMYLIEDYEGAGKYEDVMKEMPLDIALGGQVFFYNLGKDLLKAIPNFLERKMKKTMTTQQKQILESVTAGIKAFTQSQEGIYSNLTRSQDNHLQSV